MTESAQRPDSTEDLSAAMRERILVIDGAMGTVIQGHHLEESDYRAEVFADHGHDLKGNSDVLTLEQLVDLNCRSFG